MTLEQYINRRGGPHKILAEEWQAMTLQLLNAVVELSRNWIAHRDIKVCSRVPTRGWLTVGRDGDWERKSVSWCTFRV